MEVHLKHFIKNFFEALLLLLFVSFASGKERSYLSMIYISLCFSIIITLYDFYDEKGRDAVRNSLLISIGNRLMF